MGNSPSKDGSNSTATTLNSTGSSTLLSPPQPANDDPDPSRSSSSRSHINQQALNSHIINNNSSSLDDTKKSRALNIKNTSNDTQITTNTTTTTTRHSHSSISRSKPFNSKLKPSSSPSSISSNSPPSRHNSHSNSHPNSNSHSHSHSHHQSNNHGSALKPSKSNRSTTSSSSLSSPSSSSPSSSSSTAPTSTTGYSNNNISPFELELAASTAKAFNISRSPKSNITSATGNSNNDEMASSVSSNVSGFTAESVTSISSVTTTPPNLKDIQSLYPIDERSVENTPEPSSNYSSLNYNLSSSSSTSLLSQNYSPAPTDDHNNHKNNENKNFNDLQIFNQEIEDHFEITKIPTSNSSTTDSTLTDSKIKSIDMKKKISTNKKSKSLERTSTSSTSNNSSGIDLDTIINDLINLGLSKKLPRKFNLSQKEIKYICAKARDTFLHQPMLLELAAPVKVVGDLHGQFNDLLRIFKMCGYPPNANYLFLGDYVDRGKQSLETMILLLCLKVKYPENFFLLRGNHESASITKMYGFFDECKRRSNVKTWKIIVDVFNTLPVAATIADRIFCVHGGLSPQLTDLKQIKSIQRPTDIPETGLLADLLWSDPESSNSEWSENDRGVSYCFNKKVVNKFNDRFEFDLIARGHMVVEQGYEFFAKRKLVTIFSAPNYCGEFNNWGAVMNVDKKLMCSFELLKPNAISNSSNSLSPFKK
ncbi:hypothetical protein B5S30_g1001 [[Candida] boidinii]|nr:hypothetical protein B5S30_g1001 [[Candida] boidinii]